MTPRAFVGQLAALRLQGEMDRAIDLLVRMLDADTAGSPELAREWVLPVLRLSETNVDRLGPGLALAMLVGARSLELEHTPEWIALFEEAAHRWSITRERIFAFGTTTHPAPPPRA